MIVLVRPGYQAFLKNKLFQDRHPDGLSGLWLAPHVEWRHQAASRGIILETWDCRPLQEADLIWFEDLPPTRAEFEMARRANPRAKMLLQIMETPVDRGHLRSPLNHTDFDAVMTTDKSVCDERRYFHFQLAIGRPTPLPAQSPYSDRKNLLLLQTNFGSGKFRFLQNGMKGVPYLRLNRGGWKLSLRAALVENRGELYSVRRGLARYAGRNFPGLLDIYGRGWAGEPMSKIHQWFPHRPYHGAMGLHSGDKVELLGKYRFTIAMENYAGRIGYITEKIFEPLFAGCVPIYFGDDSIDDLVPPDCFVDFRKFKSFRKLFQFVTSCPRETWQQFHDAGQEYIRSPKIDQILPPAYAARMLEVTDRIMSLQDGRRLFVKTPSVCL